MFTVWIIDNNKGCKDANYNTIWIWFSNTTFVGSDLTILEQKKGESGTHSFTRYKLLKPLI